MLALWVLMLVYEKMTKAADILGPSSNCLKISGLSSLLQFLGKFPPSCSRSSQCFQVSREVGGLEERPSPGSQRTLALSP